MIVAAEVEPHAAALRWSEPAPLALTSTRPPEIPAEVQGAPVLTLEEAKETGAALTLPPAVDYETTTQTEVVVAKIDANPAETIWLPEAVPAEADAEQFIRHITIEEVLAVSGLLPDEADQLIAPPLAATSPFATTEIAPFVVSSDREQKSLTPEQAFDQFAGGLLVLASFDSLEVESAEPQTEATETPEASQSILSVVAERLLALEPENTEVATPIVQALTGAIAELRTLQSALTSPAELAEAEDQIRQLSMALLEAIGIEYDEKALHQFVRRLLQPDFLPTLAKTAEAIDLEHIGTHEVKRHFPQFFTTLADLFAEVPAGYLLGKFALFCESLAAEWPEFSYAESGGIAR